MTSTPNNPPDNPADNAPASTPASTPESTHEALFGQRAPGRRPLPGLGGKPVAGGVEGWLDRWGLPLLRVGGTLAAIGLVTAAMLWNTMFAQMPQLPNRESLWTLNREPGVEFVDAKGDVLATRGPRYGRAVHLDDLPDHVVNAFIAVEDKRFLEHDGFDVVAITRATIANFRAGRTVEGGSTITQQLVKNLFLTPDQNLRRKAQEARLAFDLEQMLGKKEILELYLNRTYLGAGAYGLDAAARVYFGKTPADLTVAEAAMLAAFPKAPSRFASAAKSTQARERQHYVLDQMVEAKFITAAQADAAKRQPLAIAPDRKDAFSGHALDYAVEQAANLLPNAPPDLVIQLTLDLDMQKAAQQAVETVVAEAASSRASEGAAVIMDSDGAIRAMVGGRNYAESKFNRATQARRQPGSAFKMFVYAAALENGLRPTSIRYDEPIRIGNWRPRNYYGDYRGAVSLSEALAESLNTVAAQVGSEIGISKVTELARRFGIRTELHNYPSVTLGSDEVRLLDLTAGYGVLAREGLQMSPYIIGEIRNSRGDVLYRHPETEAPRIYREELAHDMTGMLSRVVVQGTGRAARFGAWEVAGKTGTSQGWRDAWFIGYTTRYVGGVWVGNDDDRPMSQVTGGAVPTRIFSMMMTTAHEGLTPEPLPGAKQAEEFLSFDDQNRLNFYRRLSAAFGSVAARGGNPNL